MARKKAKLFRQSHRLRSLGGMFTAESRGLRRSMSRRVVARPWTAGDGSRRSLERGNRKTR
jgi:hypothetical protein